jgi:hypothetical protein
MHIAGPTEDEAIAALEQLKKTVRIAFCGVMQSTPLPPMAALSLAAMAVGSLYHDRRRPTFIARHRIRWIESRFSASLLASFAPMTGARAKMRRTSRCPEAFASSPPAPFSPDSEPAPRRRPLPP